MTKETKNNSDTFSVYMRPVYDTINTTIDIMNSASNKLYNNTLGLFNDFAGKMQNFGDFMAGKDSKADSNMTKQHFQYINDLRKMDNKRYLQLKTFGNELRKLPANERKALVDNFFRNYS